MKKRILSTHDNQGNKLYFIQRRMLGFWMNIKQDGKPVVFTSKSEAISRLHIF